MTQEEKWRKRYEEVKTFIETNKRNPSKYRIEEHDMLNWVKATRKRMNAGKIKAERVEKFKELLAMTEQYRRKKSDRGTGSVSPRCKYPKYVESDRGLNQSVSEAA